MVIGGLKKITSDEDAGRNSIIVYSQGCDFSCTYCFLHEFIEINEGSIGEKEALEYIRSHKDSSRWVCLSGGEPTMQYNLFEFIGNIKNMGLKIKLETSGIYPNIIQKLIEQELLDFICMDIKNVWEKYSKIVGGVGEKLIENCKKSFSIIQPSSVMHEFRTTYIPQIHQDEDIYAIAGYLKDNEKYCIQNIRSSSDYHENFDFEKGPKYLSALIDGLRLAFPRLEIYER